MLLPISWLLIIPGLISLKKDGDASYSNLRGLENHISEAFLPKCEGFAL